MKRAIIGLLRQVRMHFCRHRWHIDDLQRNGEFVYAPCMRCGKILRASYGIVMPGESDWSKRP